jgi:hypothetical protein
MACANREGMRSPERNSLRAAWASLAIAFIAASGSPALGASGDAKCKRGAPECPIPVDLRNQKLRVVAGRLSPRRPNFSYSFAGREGQTFSWKCRVCPAVKVLLRYPDGNTEGPGLDSEIPLPQSGKYVFSIASNTMAENIYGNFRIGFKLISNQ